MYRFLAVGSLAGVRGRIVGIGLTISVVVVASAAVGVGIGWLFETPQRPTVAGVSGAVKSSGTARVGGKFSMIDQRGMRVTDRDFLGKFMLVFFGYTYCPDICPTVMKLMGAALDSLGPAAERIQPIFVTVDPERDTVEVMAEYLSKFRSGFVGLTGTAEQVADIARTYGVFYFRDEQPDALDRDENYRVNHSSFIFLMDGKGKFRRVFRPDLARDGMARQIRAELAK
jgi:protein SCO1